MLMLLYMRSEIFKKKYDCKTPFAGPFYLFCYQCIFLMEFLCKV